MLKPGGVAVISDFKNTGPVREGVSGSGTDGTPFVSSWDMFPPLTMVEARKPKTDMMD